MNAADDVLAAFPSAELMCDDETYEWLKQRVTAVIDAGHKELMRGLWPEGVPTFKSGEPLTMNQADQLAAAISLVEKQTGLAFPTPQPGIKLVEPRPVVEPRPSRPDEGVILTDNDPRFAELVDIINSKPSKQIEWVKGVIAAAKSAGYPINGGGAGGVRSARRYHILAGLTAIADCQCDDLVVRVAELATGHTLNHLPLGVTVGALTCHQADRFHRISDAIDATELDVIFGETVTVTGDIQAAIAAQPDNESREM